MCWRFPAALFSVSKELTHDATELFFSANIFMIWEDIALENNHLDRSETLWLLRRMPVRALKYLRWLRFTYRWVSWSRRLNSPSTPDPWQQAVGMIHQHLLTSKLNIELDFRYRAPWFSWETPSEADSRWNCYRTLASVFEFNGPFKNFFVHLASFRNGPREEDQLRIERERELEHRLMGSEYDAAARGKYTNRGKSAYDIFWEQPPVFGPDGVVLSAGWEPLVE